MIDPGELRRGIAIELDGKLYTVISYEHNKVGRGSAQVRLKLKDVRGGHTLDRTFQASARFQRARIDKSPMQFLYEDNGLYYFMNAATFEQIALTKDQVGDALDYLKENETCEVLTHGEDRARQPLAQILHQKFKLQTLCPALEETLVLD